MVTGAASVQILTVQVQRFQDGEITGVKNDFKIFFYSSGFEFCSHIFRF